MSTEEIAKLLTLGIAPCIAIALFVLIRDKNKKQQQALLANSFILGALAMVLALLFAKVLNMLYNPKNDTIAGTLLYAFINVALTEEFSKFFFVRYFSYPKKVFSEPFDGILYCVFVAMGFAALENIMYIFLQPSYYLSVYVGSLRMITAIPLHASVAVIMGYFVGLAKFNHNSKSFLIVGLLAATIMHGTYDYFLFRGYYFLTIAGAIISLLISIWISFWAIKHHNSYIHLLPKKQRRKILKATAKKRIIKKKLV
jgi:RsiW-degrading membrane proteinase PrsW (M82 family)